jgi:hypothetical protein
MTEASIWWGGTVIGDHGTYTDDQFSDFICSLMQSDRTTQAPLYGLLNSLAITNPAGTTIRVASGKAIVDGKGYTNTANVDFSVTAPGAGFNYYTVVLRKSWAAQTIRLVMLGPSALAYPMVTQTDGTTWEVTIAQVRISNASVITITDTRVYCTPSKQIDTSQIGSGQITPAKLSADAFPISAVGDMLYAVDADTLARLAKGTALYELRQNAGLTAPEWVIVTPQTIVARQGGSATAWGTGGSNNYAGPLSPTVQVGVARIYYTNPGDAVDVWLPAAFSYKPLVFVFSPIGESLGIKTTFAPFLSSNVVFTVRAYSNTPGPRYISVPWIAIGN